MVRLMRRTIKRIGINSVEGKPIVDYCKKTLIKLLPKKINRVVIVIDKVKYIRLKIGPIINAFLKTSIKSLYS